MGVRETLEQYAGTSASSYNRVRIPGFVILPRRWIIERSWAWAMHSRRLVRDYERLPQHTGAMFTIAAITLMTH